MSVLRVLAFGFGYLTGGFVGAVAAGVISMRLRDDVRSGPSPAGVAAIMVSIFVCGLAGGYLCSWLVSRSRRYDSVQADYDDRPPTDPAR
jgi:hypothetical protein